MTARAVTEHHTLNTLELPTMTAPPRSALELPKSPKYDSLALITDPRELDHRDRSMPLGSIHGPALPPKSP